MANLTFISGATGGLGKAFAVECARRGWDLVLTDLETHRLATLADSLKRTYDITVHTAPCDLTDPEARTALFAHLHTQGLRFTNVINVAGVDFEGMFEQCTREEIRTIIRLNIESTLDVTHALLEMAAVGNAFHIINVASLAAFYPMPVKATYAASKRFLLDFSLALHNELRDKGGSVTVLCPAGMPTNPGSRKGIEAQGMIGQLTTKDIGAVAAQTLDAALKGKTVVIPGAINQFLQFAGGLIPRQSLVGLIGSRWRAARKKREPETPTPSPTALNSQPVTQR